MNMVYKYLLKTLPCEDSDDILNGSLDYAHWQALVGDYIEQGQGVISKQSPMKAHVSPVPTHTQLMGSVPGVTATRSSLSGIGE